MINYYEELSGEEQQRVKESIQLLYRQTFLLERKYDRKTKRYQINREYHQCSKHLEFIQAYFALMDIEVVENSQMGVIYLRGEQLMGEKMPKLATLYLLVLKLIYDEQMSTVSTSVNAMTNLSEIHEKLNTYRLLKKQPSNTEIRRSLALLKRYQIVEPLDVLDELDGFSRLVIYPAIHVVLLGGDSSGLKFSVRSRLTNQQTPRIATQRTTRTETIKPLDWKNFFMCVHTPSLLLYKAYTAELTDVSTAPLKFGIMVASQFYPLCDSRVVVPKHPHIELHITIEDILDPIAHHIELQADVGYLIVVRGKRNFGGKSACHRGLQHFRVVTAGIEGAQVLFKVSFPLGAVSVRIDGGAQVVQLHFSAVSDVDASDPH